MSYFPNSHFLVHICHTELTGYFNKTISYVSHSGLAGNRIHSRLRSNEISVSNFVYFADAWKQNFRGHRQLNHISAHELCLSPYLHWNSLQNSKGITQSSLRIIISGSCKTVTNSGGRGAFKWRCLNCEQKSSDSRWFCYKVIYIRNINKGNYSFTSYSE